jgi:hypothetical protein
MNKYILPSAAAFLILVIAVSSYTPAMAVSRITLAPFLQVVTIPQDDQVRNTGIIILNRTPVTIGALTGTAYADFMAQYKLVITLNGVLVNNALIDITCNVAEKDKIINKPDVTTGKSPSKNRQFPRELMETEIKDVADMFECKARWKPGGLSVGVLDVYYTGAEGDAAFIADHIVVVHVTYTLGRQVFEGTEIQDVCVLGWSFNTVGITSTVIGTNLEKVVLDPRPLMDYQSCETAALAQLLALGLWP